jgi:4-hydroxy-tetrahydrodipicolinate synthase
MKRDELRKIIVGPMATVATPLDSEYKVDYGKMHDLTNWWIDSGLKTGNSVIKVAAAMGEGPQLRDTEWPHLLRTTVQASKGRVPIMCGIHYKDTIRAIEDIKLASDLGAVAVQLSAPIHNGPTEDDNLRFYEDVSKAIDIGILIYNTHAMAGGAISVDGFRKMVDFENVVAIKWSPPPAERPIPGKYEEIFELNDTFNIIDNCFGPVKCFKLGGHGYINHTVDIYPQHDIKLLDLLRNEKYEEAEQLWDSVEGPIGIFSAKVGGRSGGQARVKKGMMEVMGNSCGVSRPPSEPLLQSEIDELREILRSFGWPVAK